MTLLEVFDRAFKDVVFNSKLATAIYKYQIGYVNNNREHIEFFGSNLLGVHVVRFKDSDVNRFFDDVLNVDMIHLAKDITLVPDINQEFKISSDTYNLTIMYVLHRFMTVTEMPEATRDRACYDTALLFYYRTVAALISNNFRYPADPKIAQAAYSQLSNKYLIKRLGSWHKVMDYRAKDLINPKAIHYKALVSFNDDLAIVYAINDSQGRVRDLIKNYYSEFIKVHSEGGGVGVTSSTYIDGEGRDAVKELTRSTVAHVNYIRTIIADRNSFIKDDLVNIVTRLSVNSSQRTIRATLLWLSETYNTNSANSQQVEEWVSLVVVHGFYLVDNSIRPRHYRDYGVILAGLKNRYLASRSTDPDLIRIRSEGEALITASSGRHMNHSLILATRTSIMLYIMLRTLVGINK